MRLRDKQGIMLELDNRFKAIEKRQRELENKIVEFKEDLRKSRLPDD